MTAASAEKFVLKSPDIKQGQKVGVEQVFSGMGCTGKTFTGPEVGRRPGNKGLAVTVYDPDASGAMVASTCSSMPWQNRP